MTLEENSKKESILNLESNLTEKLQKWGVGKWTKE